MGQIYTSGVPQSSFYFEEERPAGCYPLENTTAFPNTPLTLFSATGAGSVDAIQLAIINPYSDGSTSTLDSTLSIYINGESSPSISMPVGLFMLTYGNSNGTSDLFGTNNFSVTEIDLSGSEILQTGGFRKIYIPYTNGIKITFTNLASDNSAVYTQVYYHVGADPLWLTGSRRKRLRCQVIQPFTTIQPLAAFTPLNISGVVGELEGIHLFSINGTAGQTWLEGNVIINLDGANIWSTGGTEDFFLNQYYGDQIRVKADWAGMNQSNSYFVSAYRIFDRKTESLVFNNSATITMNNGQSGETGSPSTAQFGTVVFYYTTS